MAPLDDAISRKHAEETGDEVALPERNGAWMMS
jgi:hypothetical protein